ncbi:MAG: inositol monophosphatase [Micrococcales bacterium]|nr:inositol monophosphatase [Micrococcales bacterium]
MTSELVDLARSIAVEAGELAARRRAEGVEVAAQKSSATDVVTAADREVELLIRERLQAARPDDAILGEEGGGLSGSSGLSWLVDPIDGTTNYLYGVPHYAVSVAVVEGDPDPLTWTALAGAVRNPATGELYSAAAGEGSTLDGRPIRVAEPVPLAQALVGTGFSYLPEIRREQGELIARMLPRIRDLRRPGTASLDLCFVAAGRSNAYFERGLNPWDHAAGVLIAREAGAAAFGIDRRPPDVELTLAGHPHVADALARLLDERDTAPLDNRARPGATSGPR